jgi:regulatory protein YycI of two-component signal transduction system YycFG
MKRSEIIILVLVILLGISFGYIIFEKLQMMQQQAFQTGYSQGFQDAVISLYQQTNNCRVTTIRIGNVTREIIDANCLTKS